METWSGVDTQIVEGSRRSLWEDPSPSGDTCVPVSCSSTPISCPNVPKYAKNEGLLHWGAPEHSLSCTDRRKQSAASTCSGLSALVRFPMPILRSSSGQTYPNKICTMVGSPAAETQDRHRKVFERHQSPRRTSCRPAYRTGVHHSTREVVLFRSPPALFFTNLF